MKRDLRLRLEGLGWLAGWRLARMLPERTVVGAFERLSARSHRRNAKLREIVRANLEPIVPPEHLDESVRQAFRWYGRYWAETFRMSDLPDDELERRFRIEGFEHLEAAYAGGRGVIVATLHMGNWDAGGRWLSMRMSVAAVAEVLRPRVLFDRFLEHRRDLGITIIPLERGVDVTAACMARLEAGDVLGLLADRDLSRSAVEVTMFGRSAMVPPGPAVLALRRGCPLLAGAIYQNEDGTWDTLVTPPIEQPSAADPDAVAVLTQRVSDAIATLIRRRPEQWHMMAPFWRDR